MAHGYDTTARATNRVGLLAFYKSFEFIIHFM